MNLKNIVIIHLALNIFYVAKIPWGCRHFISGNVPISAVAKWEATDYLNELRWLKFNLAR
jgi:hypothetical protein